MHAARQMNDRTSALVISLFCVASAANAASYNFTRIADTSGPYATFAIAGTPESGLPTINSGGVVAFWATLDAGGSSIVTGNGTDLIPIASTGLVYTGFGRGLPMINNFGDVAYFASRTSGGNALFRTGAVVASGSDGFSELHDSPAIDPLSGLVAFRGSKVITPSFSTPGLWVASGAVAGPAEIATGTSSISSEGPSLSSTNQVAWVGTYLGKTGVHVGSGGTVRTWVDTTGIYSGFGLSCAITADNQIVFLANLDAGGSGVYVATLTPTELIIKTVATSAGVLSVWGTPSINPSGKVVFRSTAWGGATLYTGSHLVADKVAGGGDTLDGRTISDVRSSKQAINETGRIAFRAAFSDGTAGVYRAVPCPADVNGDHYVTVDDLLLVIAAWGASSGPADVNRNGSVTVDDLLGVIHAWGPCPVE